jgi:hypothetical protein
MVMQSSGSAQNHVSGYTYQALNRATFRISIRLLWDAHHTVTSDSNFRHCRRLSSGKTLDGNAGRNHLARKIWKLRPRVLCKFTFGSYRAQYSCTESKSWNSYFGERPRQNGTSDARRA